jgi:hypothetical protein
LKDAGSTERRNYSLELQATPLSFKKGFKDIPKRK